MPIIASAKKQLRQSLKRKKRNDHFRSLYRETRVAFEKAIKAKDLETAKSLYVNQKDKD
jgi:ribosomal protein S20